jgi:hypothetical protein
MQEAGKDGGVADALSFDGPPASVEVLAPAGSSERESDVIAELSFCPSRPRKSAKQTQLLS